MTGALDTHLKELEDLRWDLLLAAEPQRGSVEERIEYLRLLREQIETLDDSPAATRIRALTRPTSLAEVAARPPKPFGELLVLQGSITEHEHAAALAEQARHGGRIGEILLARGQITEDELTRALATQWGLERMSLGAEAVPGRIDLRTALELGVVVVNDHDQLAIASSEQLDFPTRRLLRTVTGIDRVVVAPVRRIHELTARAFGDEIRSVAAAVLGERREMATGPEQPAPLPAPAAAPAPTPVAAPAPPKRQPAAAALGPPALVAEVLPQAPPLIHLKPNQKLGAAGALVSLIAGLFLVPLITGFVSLILVAVYGVYASWRG